MSKEEKIKYQDLLVLFEETKGKIKEAGLLCDTLHMSPKTYDLVMAGLEELSGVEKMPISDVMCLGLKLIKHKNMPENTVVFSHLGKVKKIEDWDLRGIDNGTQKNTKKESTKKCSV